MSPYVPILGVLFFSAILLAVLLSMGQFIARTDLAIVVAALTSSLAWGARLPIGDLLGGLGVGAVGDHPFADSTLPTADRKRARSVLSGWYTTAAAGWVPTREFSILQRYRPAPSRLP